MAKQRFLEALSRFGFRFETGSDLVRIPIQQNPAEVEYHIAYCSHIANEPILALA
jgi:hypothetical protein